MAPNRTLAWVGAMRKGLMREKGLELREAYGLLDGSKGMEDAVQPRTRH